MSTYPLKSLASIHRSRDCGGWLSAGSVMKAAGPVIGDERTR